MQLLTSRIPPESYIRKAVEFVKTNRGLDDKEAVGTGAYNSRYGIVDTSGELQSVLYLCHKKLGVMTNAAVSFSTLIRNTREWTKESADAWFDWILDPVKSPWREALPKEGYVLDGEDINGKEFMTKYGFVFWHIHTLPSNVQHQMFIASRMPTEWPWLIQTWHEFVRRGLTKEFALVLMGQFDPTPTDKDLEAQYPESFQGFFERETYRFTGDNFYDFPLDLYSCDEEYVLNFLCNKMTGRRNKPFSDDPSYRPVNILWGDGGYNYSKLYGPDWHPTDEYKAKRYSHLFQERYKSFGNTVDIKSTMGSNSRRTTVEFPKDVLMEIATREQQRLYEILVQRKLNVNA